MRHKEIAAFMVCAHAKFTGEVGERVLLPAVRNAKRDTLIITDGYRCREQIAEATGVRALHLAEVLQIAFKGLPR